MKTFAGPAHEREEVEALDDNSVYTVEAGLEMKAAKNKQYRNVSRGLQHLLYIASLVLMLHSSCKDFENYDMHGFMGGECSWA